MAETAEDAVLRSFTEAAGSLTQTVESLTGLGRQDGSGTMARASENPGAGSEALSIATTVLESGLGIVPLVTGLIGLFSGGGASTPPPLVKYAMPTKIAFEGADTGDGISEADYDQMGMPRSYSGVRDGTPASVPSGAPGGSSGAGPQIQVNVQAMDAQSFVDHSNDIAQAVRSAMLNLNSLNDLVSDL